MSENLKVNANSSVLEHKRKHNLLVDVVPQKDTDGNYKILENIADSQGHKRFIEGEIALSSIDGVTKTYGKWSLSGSHLLIVLCVDIVNETALTVGILGTLSELPSWLIGKVVPTFSNAIEYKSFNMFSDNLSSQNIGIYLRKPTTTSIDIYIASNVTLTADRHCRIAFDLLIDDAEPEVQGE